MDSDTQNSSDAVNSSAVALPIIAPNSNTVSEPITATNSSAVALPIIAPNSNTVSEPITATNSSTVALANPRTFPIAILAALQITNPIAILAGTMKEQVAQFLGLLAFIFTSHYFVNSAFFVTLGYFGAILTALFFLGIFVLLLPFPSLPDMQGRYNIFYHSMRRAIVSVGLYFFFNWIGECLDFHQDSNLRKASLWFLLYLLCNEVRYRIEAEIALCDGYLFAGLGLMFSQEQVSHWVVFPIAVAFLCVVNYISSSEESGEGIGRIGTQPETRLKAKIFGSISLAFLVHEVNNSNFYASLGFLGSVFTWTFFCVPVGILFTNLPLMVKSKCHQGLGQAVALLSALPSIMRLQIFLHKWLAKVPVLVSLTVNLNWKIFVHCWFKAMLSMACYFAFNSLSKTLALTEDLSLMKASLGLLGFILAAECILQFEEEVAICDGYLYAGYGTMLSKKSVPRLLVFAIGIVAQWIKTHSIMSRSQGGQVSEKKSDELKAVDVLGTHLESRGCNVDDEKEKV